MSHNVMQKRRQSRRAPRALLRVEQLEDRSLLSGGGINYQVLATLGDPLPGVAGGTFVNDFEPGGLNNHGDVAFAGIVQTDQGVHVPGEDYIGLGAGIFQADAKGHITNVVSPGDKAPGGGKFDYAVEPWVNDGGAVAFVGHIAGEDSVISTF